MTVCGSLWPGREFNPVSSCADRAPRARFLSSTAPGPLGLTLRPQPVHFAPVMPQSLPPQGHERSVLTTMASLTIVGFASGSPLSQLAMARVARDHRLVAIVVPPQRGGLLQKLRQKLRRVLRRSPDPLAGFGVPLIAAGKVGRFKPDIIVVASFPQIIPEAVLATARIGALNMHASALPRHRG